MKGGEENEGVLFASKNVSWYDRTYVTGRDWAASPAAVTDFQRISVKTKQFFMFNSKVEIHFECGKVNI